MKIAIIGWGSLIWCPGSLRIISKWHGDGPMLPIEFARISNDGRLTLVLYDASENVQSYWSYSAFDNIGAARKNLAEREGSRLADIHSASRKDKAAASEDAVKALVQSWLSERNDVEAAVWTALPSNWEARRGRFTAEDAVKYFQELRSERDEATARYKRACEYIRNAPAQIQTNVRRLLREKYGLNDAQLSAVLFEVPET